MWTKKKQILLRFPAPHAKLCPSWEKIGKTGLEDKSISVYHEKGTKVNCFIRRIWRNPDFFYILMNRRGEQACWSGFWIRLARYSASARIRTEFWWSTGRGSIEYHRIPLNSYWCSQDTVGRHILELYPELDGESSTILTALRTGRASYNVLQDINNHRGERVLLESTTIPIVVDGRVECVVDSSKYHTIDQRVIRAGRAAACPPWTGCSRKTRPCWPQEPHPGRGRAGLVGAHLW